MNIFLRPLIKEMKELWQWIEVYDSHLKYRFKLRAVYLWSIYDYLAFDKFIGWCVHGWSSDEDATGHVIDYYCILQNIVKYTFDDAKELKVMFFQCDWFDPINDTRVDEFSMVEVKHESRYSGSNLLLAHMRNRCTI
jgi:hypothetical protein